MSEKNTNVGTIGQKYEERKSGKTGVLISRDEDARMLNMQGVGGSMFTVSYAAFRSNWRKAAEPTMPEVSPEEPVLRMTRDAFLREINRKASISEDGCTVTLYVEDRSIDVLVCTMKDEGYCISMLPDIYTYANFGNHVLYTQFALMDVMSVTCGTNFFDIENVYAAVVEAVRDLNLYGYFVETEEE